MKRIYCFHFGLSLPRKPLWPFHLTFSSPKSKKSPVSVSVSLCTQMHHRTDWFIFFVSWELDDMSHFTSPMRLSSSLIKKLKNRVRAGSNPLLSQYRSFTAIEGHRPVIVHKRSLDILHDPWFNKVFWFVFRFLCVVWLINIFGWFCCRGRRFPLQSAIVLISGDFSLQMSWHQTSKSNDSVCLYTTLNSTRGCDMKL